MPINRDGTPVPPLDEQATYAMERAAATAPAKSTPGKWKPVSARDRYGAQQLVIGGVPVATITKVPGEAAHLWQLEDGSQAGIARGYYAAQRAVRKALREVRDGE